MIIYIAVGYWFQGAIVGKRVTEITLAEFLSYGPQKEPGNVIVIFFEIDL